MSEKKELYSPQTRQTRTALGISSATLFVFSAFGRFPENEIAFKYGPGPFEITNATFPLLFLGATMYFVVSFIISARHDRWQESHPEPLDTLIKCADAFDTARGEILTHMEENKVSFHNTLVAERTKLTNIPTHTFQKMKSLTGDNEDLKNITLIEKTISQLIDITKETSPTKRLENEFEAIDKAIGENCSEVRGAVDGLIARGKGIQGAKNDWLEFYAPLGGAGLAVFTLLARWVFPNFLPISF